MPERKRGLSLHIGLNTVDPDHYQGWSGELGACEFDAEDMERIAKRAGMRTISLLTKKATRANVLKAMKEAAETLKSGDIFVLTYSGHGGQFDDYSGDETDNLDETWCLYDAQLIDDEIYESWSLFEKGVRILMISDSCHSGTIFRNSKSGLIPVDAGDPQFDRAYHPRAIPARDRALTFRRNQEFYFGLQKKQIERGWKGAVREGDVELGCTVRLFSGCMDRQFSYDGVANGQFTGRLLRVWDDGRFTGNYQKFHLDILRGMPENQSPEHRIIGAPNPDFDAEKPFVV